MVDGIYTLANDVVYDQLVALLNSIEANLGTTYPVCVIPYDDNLENVKQELQKRDNVTLLDNPDIIARWEDFATQIWQAHPTAMGQWQKRGITGVNRLGMHRRFCAFDEESPFDRFIYLDGDVVVFDSPHHLFEKLDHYDFVVYDYQYKIPHHVYHLSATKLYQLFSEEQIQSEVFCAGVYTAKRDLFPLETRQKLIQWLQAGDAEILYQSAPDQSILNYMVMRSEKAFYNFARHLPFEQRIGCDATSPNFEQRGAFLYDKGIKLTYLHYIGVPSWVITRVCRGENFDFAYRDIFLHYRYLYTPENRPPLTGKLKRYNAPPTLFHRFLRKFGIKIKP